MPVDTIRVPDEIMVCSNCGWKVMAKGDWHGWKGSELTPGELTWFCHKPPCKEAHEAAIVEWQAAQGYVTTSDE